MLAGVCALRMVKVTRVSLCQGSGCWGVGGVRNWAPGQLEFQLPPLKMVMKGPKMEAPAFSSGVSGQVGGAR